MHSPHTLPDRHRAAVATDRIDRFDVDALRSLVGDKVFSRGEAYCRDGLVQLLTVASKRVLAQVAGTEDYRVELTGRGRSVDGTCSCRAFEDWGFCKHIVATALAANQAGDDAEAESAGVHARIREHLAGKGIAALVEMIMDLVERDPVLFRKLEIATLATHADEKTLEARLGKVIDGATHTRGFLEYHEAANWAEGVDAALDAIAALPGKHAGLVLRLVTRTIDRIECAIENLDDSDGHCGALLERASDIHRSAAHAAQCEPVTLARDLFAREMKGGYYETFNGAAGLYADILGEEGLAEYRRLAVEAWDKLPPVSGKNRTGPGLPDGHYRLWKILDFFAERDGDVAARIALRAKDLSSPRSYLQLAEFCLSQGRAEEALCRAEDGLWVFEDDPPDERLVFFVVDLLSKVGRKGDAEARLWHAFEKAPSLELYQRLRKAGTVARDQAIKLLETRLMREKPAGWYYPADLLISVMMQDKQFDAAWANMRKYGSSAGLKERLARASELTHPREALEIYAGRVDQLAQVGGDGAYAAAAALIGHMADLRDASEHAAYVADVKIRFGRKRNFMKLLA